MECSDVRKWICAYLDNELEEEIRIPVEEHIASCIYCENELKSFQSARHLLRRRRNSVKAPDDFKKRIATELKRADEYRESGIKALDLIPWGTHIAQLYNKESDLTEILAPYLASGLEQNECCLWVTSEISKREIMNSLKGFLQRDPYEYLDKGQLQIVSYEEWYFSTGSFDVNCILNNAMEMYKKSLSEGYIGLRATGSPVPSHSLSGIGDWDFFMEYEKLLDNAISNTESKFLVICSYRENICKKGRIEGLINTHKYLVSRSSSSWRAERSSRLRLH